MDTPTRILVLTLLISLASAQINFSTSWGKRSSSAALPSSLGSASSLPSLRQQFHSRKEPTLQQHQQQLLQQTLPESATLYGDVDQEQTKTVVLPSPCLSLLKSLLLVNQIVEV